MCMPAGASDYAANDNDISAVAAAVSVITDLDDSLHSSCTLPTVDDEAITNVTTGNSCFFHCCCNVLMVSN